MVGVGAVIKRGNAVLLVRRSQEPAKGLWSIPGGLVKLGETMVDAVRREVKEETDLHIESIQLLDVVDNIVHDDLGKIRFHYVLVDFLARPTGQNEPKALSDVLEVRWVKAEELCRYELTKTTRRLLDKIGFTK